MKKIFLGTILMTLLCTACAPEFPDPVTITLSDSLVDEYCHSSNNKIILVEINNTTERDVELEWRHSGEQAGWSYTVDGSAANLGGMINLRANSKESFLLTITPNGNIDKVTGMIEFYDVENTSVALKTCSYSLTSFASYFKISPLGAMSGSTSIVNNSTTNYGMAMINENSVPVNVQWERMNEVLPNSWEVSVAPWCLAPSVMRGEFIIPANGSIEFGLIFHDRNTLGTGESTATFWVEEDRLNSIKRQQIEHTVVP
ncbi:MAG: hypothetical protein JKY03_08350 [Aureispira sp.]|nr:hypothetical protein [Aureispira sp.]